MDPLPGGPDWMKISPVAGSLFHEKEQMTRARSGATVVIRSIALHCQFILCFCLIVSSVVALAELLGRSAIRSVDDASALYRRPCKNGVGPALHVRIVLRTEKFSSIVGPALHKPAIPGKDRHVGDSVSDATKEFALCQTAIEYVELTFYFHGEAVDCVFDFYRRISVKMTKTAAQMPAIANLAVQ